MSQFSYPKDKLLVKKHETSIFFLRAQPKSWPLESNQIFQDFPENFLPFWMSDTHSGTAADPGFEL